MAHTLFEDRTLFVKCGPIPVHTLVSFLVHDNDAHLVYRQGIMKHNGNDFIIMTKNEVFTIERKEGDVRCSYIDIVLYG